MLRETHITEAKILQHRRSRRGAHDHLRGDRIFGIAFNSVERHVQFHKTDLLRNRGKLSFFILKHVAVAADLCNTLSGATIKPQALTLKEILLGIPFFPLKHMKFAVFVMTRAAASTSMSPAPTEAVNWLARIVPFVPSFLRARIVLRRLHASRTHRIVTEPKFGTGFYAVEASDL